VQIAAATTRALCVKVERESPRFDVQSPAPIRPKASPKSNVRNLPRVVPGAIVRVMVLAFFAVAACVWAIVHMTTRKPQPMVVPPEPAPSEIPAPEISP
jgi:hypothetical protein